MIAIGSLYSLFPQNIVIAGRALIADNLINYSSREVYSG